MLGKGKKSILNKREKAKKENKYIIQTNKYLQLDNYIPNQSLDIVLANLKGFIIYIILLLESAFLSVVSSSCLVGECKRTSC